MEHIVFTCKQTTGSNNVASLLFREEGIAAGMASRVSDSDIVMPDPTKARLAQFVKSNLVARVKSALVQQPTGPLQSYNIFSHVDVAMEDNSSDEEI